MLKHYFDIFVNGYAGYAGYLFNEITHPSWHNYFYWLLGVSLFFMALEWIAPWRPYQAKFRKDFWLDAFYMFFNFFLFSLIIYNAASDVFVNLFKDLLHKYDEYKALYKQRFGNESNLPTRFGIRAGLQLTF